MDPPGDQPGEPLLPRVITSPPPPEINDGLEAPKASANSSSLASTRPPADRGPGNILDHTGGGLSWQHPPEQQQQQPSQQQQQQQQAQESRDKQNVNAVDDAGGSQPPLSGGTNPRAFSDDAGDASSKLNTVLRAVHAVRQPLDGDVAAAALLCGMALPLAECIDALVSQQTDDALTSMFRNAGGGLRAHLGSHGLPESSHIRTRLFNDNKL